MSGEYLVVDAEILFALGRTKLLDTLIYTIKTVVIPFQVYNELSIHSQSSAYIRSRVEANQLAGRIQVPDFGYTGGQAGDKAIIDFVSAPNGTFTVLTEDDGLRSKVNSIAERR